MRTRTDAIRSLKKYTALALGDEWEVRMTDEEGAFKRPFCRVGAIPTGGSVRMEGARFMRTTQRFALVAYPIEKATPDEARLEAARVEELFMLAFGQGVHTPSYRYSTHRGHPKRIPLSDYDGIALEEPATEGDREPNDFLIVSDDPSIGSLKDEEDDLLYAVTVDLAAWWVRSVAVTAPGSHPVESVTVEGVGD